MSLKTQYLILLASCASLICKTEVQLNIIDDIPISLCGLICESHPNPCPDSSCPAIQDAQCEMDCSCKARWYSSQETNKILHSDYDCVTDCSVTCPLDGEKCNLPAGCSGDITCKMDCSNCKPKYFYKGKHIKEFTTDICANNGTVSVNHPICAVGTLPFYICQNFHENLCPSFGCGQENVCCSYGNCATCGGPIIPGSG